ncbi:hypothetical protein AGLY_004520 [Aphis glycines]|uniref:Uncharacterized protein n=1 Tax=Aphis glycines TaxID=307491 RepID=A0A6G0TYG1_APHGL|nr:hypothetical protein AGLY_004520 [Aphis glycines]
MFYRFLMLHIIDLSFISKLKQDDCIAMNFTNFTINNKEPSSTYITWYYLLLKCFFEPKNIQLSHNYIPNIFLNFEITLRIFCLLYHNAQLFQEDVNLKILIRKTSFIFLLPTQKSNQKKNSMGGGIIEGSTLLVFSASISFHVIAVFNDIMLTIFGSLRKTKYHEIFQHVDYHATIGMNVFHKKSHSIFNIILN